jgi:predicted nucleic acid-binding protein
MVLADTNVILDVVTADPRWSDWSRRQLVHWLDTGPVVINAIIYGEIGFACERIESLDALLPSHLYDYRAIPR